MYKMVNISKDTYENNDIETIVDSIGNLWLNEIIYRSIIRL